MIQVSNDMGRSWTTKSTASFSMGAFKDLLFFKKQLYAVSENGIYSSSNEGISWILVCSNSIARGNFKDIMSPDNITLIATTTNGLYKSTDDGRSWIKC